MAQRKHPLYLKQEPKPGVQRFIPQPIAIKVFETLYKHFGPQGWWPAQSPFEVVVGAILTQNTAWRNVEIALEALRSRNLLSYEAFTKLPESKLARLIRPSGFFNLKARRLKTLTRFIETEYRGSLDLFFSEADETLRNQLLSLKGLGPETVDSILLYAAGKPYFVIDAYTRRIFSRHQWVAPDIGYDTLQQFFMSQLPPDSQTYNEYHALIVKTAKLHCKKKANCQDCPLNIFPIPD